MPKYMFSFIAFMLSIAVLTMSYEPPVYAKEHKFATKRMKSPMDQGESDVDLETTAAIRRMVIDTESLSVLAKNVNIITNNGVVELSGRVKTSQEAQVINDIAKNTKNVTKVINHLRFRSPD